MRTYRLSEFVAHSGVVNCVRIGRGSAGVLATGGEDKKVNLWRIGQTEVVKSLSGLQSSVECVVFGEKEDTIAAGGSNGTVKVWDMESGKVSRSLTGHRAHCLSLAFTSADQNFLVSGSRDCNVKVWDLRRKEAIVTFKGHDKAVMKVAPSPDNKWVCSGSEDGELKVWDITSGKMIKDGWRHNSRITGLEFNQVEFLMVSSGADRTVRVWDLEIWEEVECLGPEATAVQGIAYAQDGSVLLTATADALKVWGLEPAVHHDTVPLDGRHLADLCLYNHRDNQPRALACCCSNSNVGVFMVDLKKVAPFCNSREAAAGSGPVGIGSGGVPQQPTAAALSGGGGGIGSGRLTGALLQEYTAGLQARRTDVGVIDRDTDAANHQRPLASLFSEPGAASSPPEPEAGPLTRQLPRTRTPPRPAAAVPPQAAAGLKPSSSTSNSRQAGPARTQPTPGSSSVGARRALHVQPSPPSAAAALEQQQQSDYFPEVEIRVPAGRPPQVEQQQQQQSSAAAGMQPLGKGQSSSRPLAANGRLQPKSASSHSSSRAHSMGNLADGDASAAAAQLSAGMAAVSLQESQAAVRQQQQQQQQQREVSRSNSSSSRAQDSGAPGALSATLAAWLSELPEGAPEAACNSTAAPSASSSRSTSVPASRMGSRHNMQQPQQQQQQQQPAAADPILAAMAARPGLRVELSRMVSGLQVSKGFAGRGNLEGAYKAALNQGDAALACMLLEAVSGRADAFELNSLEPLIKLLELLLAGGHEQQVAVGLSVLGLVLRGPGQTVHDVCSAPKPTGVDLSFEARRSKCMLLKLALEGLGMKLGVLSRGQGQVATRAQLMAEELKRVVAAGQ